MDNPRVKSLNPLWQGHDSPSETLTSEKMKLYTKIK